MFDQEVIAKPAENHCPGPRWHDIADDFGNGKKPCLEYTKHLEDNQGAHKAQHYDGIPSHVFKNWLHVHP